MGDKDAAVNGIKEIPIQTKPSHKFRGRMYFDHIMMEDLTGSGGIDPQDNFTGFDTIRLGVTGNIFENLKYTAEFEFEGMEVDYKDVSAQLTHLPWVGNIRIGHFKEPFGLEQMTSSRFVTFVERSVATGKPGCAKQRNVKQLVKYEVTKMVPAYKWVIVNAQPTCGCEASCGVTS